MQSSSTAAGRCAVASGVIGLVAFVCLIAYLATQADTFLATGVMPPLGRALLSGNFVGSALQALLLVPSALIFRDLGRKRYPSLSSSILIVGVVGLIGVALMRLLQFSPDISDILFMGPMGLVGVWLVTNNWLLRGTLSKTQVVLGMLAGLGLVVLGASFLFLGGLHDVLSKGTYGYADNVQFHQGIAIGGFPGFILYPVWSILLGRKFLRMRDKAAV